MLVWTLTHRSMKCLELNYKVIPLHRFHPHNPNYRRTCVCPRYIHHSHIGIHTLDTGSPHNNLQFHHYHRRNPFGHHTVQTPRYIDRYHTGIDAIYMLRTVATYFWLDTLPTVHPSYQHIRTSPHYTLLKVISTRHKCIGMNTMDNVFRYTQQQFRHFHLDNFVCHCKRQFF